MNIIKKASDTIVLGGGEVGREGTGPGVIDDPTDAGAGKPSPEPGDAAEWNVVTRGGRAKAKARATVTSGRVAKAARSASTVAIQTEAEGMAEEIRQLRQLLVQLMRESQEDRKRFEEQFEEQLKENTKREERLERKIEAMNATLQEEHKPSYSEAVKGTMPQPPPKQSDKRTDDRRRTQSTTNEREERSLR